jgi:NAD(P)-dependent dehydrogenase (short-subunit alcohol dehydrogenase family)
MSEQRKKVIVIGATGMIGSGVAALLESTWEVVRAARSGGDVAVDATSISSMTAMFARIGPYDALISVLGSGALGSLVQLSSDDFVGSFHSKVLTQINLVKLGLPTIRDRGCFTLTSGILSEDPHSGFSAIAMVNGAVEAFCRTAALELPRGIRINCVTPVFMIESLKQAGLTDFSGYPVMSVADTAQAYLWSLERTFNGRILDARNGA